MTKKQNDEVITLASVQGNLVGYGSETEDLKQSMYDFTKQFGYLDKLTNFLTHQVKKRKYNNIDIDELLEELSYKEELHGK